MVDAFFELGSVAFKIEGQDFGIAVGCSALPCYATNFAPDFNGTPIQTNQKPSNRDAFGILWTNRVRKHTVNRSSQD